MDKQNVVYPYNAILLRNEKDGLPICATTWTNLENIGSEKSQSQKITYCGTPST